ncbi:MAG: GtrA family protein [Bacteroidia bacterium]|nr:GtrA family protein [Bacteroidia bacterium]
MPYSYKGQGEFHLLQLARKYIKNRRLKKLIKFGIVGATAFGISYFVFSALCKMYLIANHNTGLDNLFAGIIPFYLLFSVTGDITGLVVGFPINKKWTFKQQVNHEKNYFWGYALVYTFSFLLNQFVLYALVEWCRGMEYISDPYISKIIATAFSAASNFLGTNFLVFKKSHVVT